ncbi:MAG TPA: acyl carrier protein [Alphaproteobacteria bacterium]|jgi:acyl carrier protein
MASEQLAAQSTLEALKRVLGEVLQIGARAGRLTADTPLLGSLPELDSMAVVAVITAIEEAFGIFVNDDEVSAETFETVGSLAAFIDRKRAA